MEFIIVTGLSGAGKSRAINVLEDIGYYCVDNMPPELIGKFVELFLQSHEQWDKVAIVTDIRGGHSFSNMFASLEQLKAQGCQYKILFLDASDETLISRYKLTRRMHPLANMQKGSIEQAISYERNLLLPVLAKADYIIDTTNVTPIQLKERITTLFLGNASSGLHIHCLSFGFKYGLPSESDLVFDVRCLPNPYYVEELAGKTGLEESVKAYVMSFPQAQGLVPKLIDLIDYLLPHYCEEGKSQLVIAVGCTGGKHRSVVFTEMMYRHLLEAGMRVSVHHRDITNA